MVRAAILTLFELAMHIASILIKAANIYKAEFRREVHSAVFHLGAIKYPLPKPSSAIPAEHPRGIGEFTKRNLDAIADILEHHGIEFFWIPTASVSPNVTRLAINAADMEQLFMSFAQPASGRGILCTFEESCLGAHYRADKLTCRDMRTMSTGRVRFS